VNAGEDGPDVDCEKIKKLPVSFTLKSNQLAELKEAYINPPKLIISDCTDEKAAEICSQQGGAITIASPDASKIFQLMGGMYRSNGATGDAFVLLAAVGDPIRIDRKNGDEIYIHHPCLNGVLFTQPNEVNRFFSNDDLRAKGLFARFLVCPAESRIGKRQIKDRNELALRESELRPLNNRIKELLDRQVSCEEAQIIGLDEEAEDAWLVFYNGIEDRFRGDLKDQIPVFNKIVTFSVKYAALFAVYDGKGHIDIDTWNRARECVEYHISAALELNRVSSVIDEYGPAIAWLEWVVKKPDRYEDLKNREDGFLKDNLHDSIKNLNGIQKCEGVAYRVLQAHNFLIEADEKDDRNKRLIINFTIEQAEAEIKKYREIRGD